MPEVFPQIALNTITHDSTANFLTSCNTHTWHFKAVLTPDHKKSAYSFFMLCRSELKKLSPLAQTHCFWKCGTTVNKHARKNYFAAIFTDRLLRPFALLRLITRRPFFVAILTRKPWVRLREVLLG